MKKVIIILVVVVLLLVCGFFIFKAVSNNSVNLPNKEELESQATEIYNDNTNDVMEGTNALYNIEGYETMSIEERSVVVGQLLKLYEQEGKIRNLEYYEDQYLYSFEYNGGVMDGVLGGVTLNDFDENLN